MKNNKAKLYMIFGIVVFMIAIVGSTFAYFFWSTTSDEETKITTSVGAATVYFDGGANIENASLRPVSDKSKGIVKTIGFKGTTSSIKANLYLDIINIDTGLKDRTFKYAIYDGSNVINEGNFSSEYLTNNTSECTDNNTTHITLLSDLSVPTSLKNYTLYIWIDGTQDNPKEMMNQTFSFKLHASGTGGIIKEGKIPDITESISNSFAYNLVNTYLNATKSDVLNNSVRYYYDEEHNMMSDIAGNLRYYGANPDNYIYFNCDDYSNQSDSTCEKWRIIGVFEGKVKIMRSSVIGTYSWDNKNSSTGAESNYGKNDWSDARLMKLLNPGYDSEEVGGSLYYNAGSGNCYSGQNNATTTCDFTTTGLKNDETRGLVSELMWYLKGWSSASVFSDQIYEYERTKGSVYSGRPTSWKGKVAIPYPSDYGYAADFNQCTVDLSSYSNSLCTGNNWMKPIFTASYNWLLTPDSGDSIYAWRVYSSGGVSNSNGVFASSGVAPVLYLNSDLEMGSGTGKSDDPYRLLTD